MVAPRRAAGARGNLAGAAIRRARAEFWAPRERAAAAATALREAVHGLVVRLQTALGAEDQDPRPWREALLALAHQTPRGLWTVEARLLYDLQKVCVDQARTVSTVDVMRWVLSLGRRPIRRELPNLRVVLPSRDLRSARRRLSRVRISDKQRRQLADVLGKATDAAEARLRNDLRPKIAAALDDVGLLPQNLPEKISRAKLVEELLDRIVERGFLTLSEVRDALARNHLKEPDCSGPKSLLRGIAALRLDGRLVETLDGVYEPGDFYLRWILRFSHLMFGTAAGRFLTLFLVIPFGVAFAVLKGLDHFIELIPGMEPHLAPPPLRGWSDFLPSLLLAVFLALVIHVPRFRANVWRAFSLLGRAIKFLLFDVVRWFLALPWVHWVVQSAVAKLVVNYGIKPLVPTLLIAALSGPGPTPWRKALALTTMFLTLNVAINSRAGRTLEELAFDAVGEGWQRFGVRPMVGLFWLVVNLFRGILQVIERLLYTVDEWLRFHSEQGRAVLLAKAVLGACWFFVAYIIRFCVNLLIEPQLNPLKHIPWVTVSHKIMALVWPTTGLHGFLLHRMDHALANLTFAAIVTLTPGIFGFLIWELTENWRLFAANRSPTLRPVLVGLHGETMPRLLRPGIHSGTIPKRFAKLRRAERKAAAAGSDPQAVRKHRDVLHHVETDLRRYIEREFLAWFPEGRDWPYSRPEVEDVRLATNTILVDLALPGAIDGPLRATFELADGRLQLDLSGKRYGHGLSPTAWHVLRTTIVGLLKTGGVEVLRFERNDSISAEETAAQCAVGTVDVTWTGWVDAWETGGDPPGFDCTERLFLIPPHRL